MFWFKGQNYSANLKSVFYFELYFDANKCAFQNLTNYFQNNLVSTVHLKLKSTVDCVFQNGSIASLCT